MEADDQQFVGKSRDTTRASEWLGLQAFGGSLPGLYYLPHGSAVPNFMLNDEQLHLHSNGTWDLVN